MASTTKGRRIETTSTIPRNASHRPLDGHLVSGRGASEIRSSPGTSKKRRSRGFKRGMDDDDDNDDDDGGDNGHTHVYEHTQSIHSSVCRRILGEGGSW